MKTILLRGGGETYVDDEDYEYLNQWKWSNRDGAARFQRIDGAIKILYMHREVLKRMGYTDEFEYAIHMDDHILNNARNNLRVAAKEGLCHYRGKNKNNTSGYKGVTAKRDKWQVSIGIGGKSQYVGTYYTREEAYAAYLKAAEKLHGDFAHG